MKLLLDAGNTRVKWRLLDAAGQRCAEGAAGRSATETMLAPSTPAPAVQAPSAPAAPKTPPGVNSHWKP